MTEDDIQDKLDEYYCEHCEGTMVRRITYHNVTCEDAIRFCPFCGEKYEEE